MSSDSDCIFCRIIRKELPCAAVFEDDAMLALMDIGPLAEGHLLAIPKRHHANVSDVPADVMAALAAHFPKLGRALKTVTGAVGFNILVNENKVAGQEVGHVHFHLIPRVAGDGLGYRWNPTSYPPGRMDELAVKYRAALGGDR
jgi:histidine triad (HIT) family protein